MSIGEDLGQVDFKARLYEQYLTGHVQQDAGTVRGLIGLKLPYLRQALYPWLPQNKSAPILDLGCGSGALMFAARQAGYSNITGVDVSPEQIDAVRQLGFADVHCEDVSTFLKKVPDGTFQTIIAFDILEHFTRPEVFSLIDELHRVLAKGGRLIVHVPNGEAIFPGSVRYGDLTHELAFTARSLSQLANACSFKLIAVKEDVPAVHGVMSLMRSIIWHAGTFYFRLLLSAETGIGLFERPLSRNLLAILEAV